MNAAEMKRAAGRALELGLTAVLTVPVVLVILAAAAAVVWLWASRMLPQPVYEPETFTQARWEELDDRGVLGRPPIPGGARRWGCTGTATTSARAGRTAAGRRSWCSSSGTGK